MLVAEQRPSPNFTEGREGNNADKVVVHTTEGGYESSIQWLRPPREGSCHYIINAAGTKMAQLVQEKNTAYHCGNWQYNLQSFGIEHEGFAGEGNFSDGLYEASALVVADLCQRYNIPVDRNHIIGHVEVPQGKSPHTDPGKLWDWDKYMGLIKAAFTPNYKIFDVPGIGSFTVNDPFLTTWNKSQWLGLPLSAERKVSEYPTVQQFSGTVQWFERGRLEYHDDTASVMFGRVGFEAMPK